MGTFAELTLVAAVAVYIVDVSGFTASWRSAVARMMGRTERSLRPLPPFDCGTCMAWWSCLIYSMVDGTFGLGTVAFSALMSCLAPVTGQALILVREVLLHLIDTIMRTTER